MSVNFLHSIILLHLQGFLHQDDGLPSEEAHRVAAHSPDPATAEISESDGDVGESLVRFEREF